MTDPYGYDQVRQGPEIGQPTWVELITARADGPLKVKLHRELLDPAGYANVRQLTLAMAPGTTRSFIRSGDRLDRASAGDAVVSGTSVVAFIGEIPGGVAQVESVLKSLPGIMPRRMIWPS